MKRLTKIFCLTLVFFAGLIFACALFFPYAEAGKFAFSLGHSQLEKMGMNFTYSDVSGSDGQITAHNVKLSGLTEASFTSLTLKPEITASILSLAPVCNIDFKGCNIRFGQNINIGDGGFLLTAGRDEMLFENLHSNGEFSLNGWLTIDRTAMKIGRAEARLNVPDDFSQNMNMLKNFLPLVQEGERWYLRRGSRQ